MFLIPRFTLLRILALLSVSSLRFGDYIRCMFFHVFAHVFVCVHVSVCGCSFTYVVVCSVCSTVVCVGCVGCVCGGTQDMEEERDRRLRQSRQTERRTHDFGPPAAEHAQHRLPSSDPDNRPAPPARATTCPPLRLVS